MIVNHLSYLLFKDKTMEQNLGTLPADLIGSSQIFWFLVGYQQSTSHAPSARFDTTQLLLAFLALEHFCRLPRPLTYETLMTVAVARTLLNSDIFDYNKEKKMCLFSELPLLIHSVCCCALISVQDIFNASGIRLFQCIGLLYAIAGRLFHSNSPGAPVGVKYARYLWLVAAWGLQLKIVWSTKLKFMDVNIYSPEVVVIGLCFLGAILQVVVFACPRENALWTPATVTVWISRHSLEIYCAHLVVLWFFYGI
mmetsp:Transcript_9625/g.18071  ORF Transcript_9625/g.18071 Transcript_9625/m.18071 type:complete len:253 (-) Transcript_9625:146-904(-)